MAEAPLGQDQLTVPYATPCMDALARKNDTTVHEEYCIDVMCCAVMCCAVMCCAVEVSRGSDTLSAGWLVVH